MRKSHHKTVIPTSNLNTSTKKENSEPFLIRVIRFLTNHWMVISLLFLIISSGLFYLVLNRKSESRSQDKYLPKHNPSTSKILKDLSTPCSHFKEIRGNVTAAENIIIGEDHDQKELTDSCINEITKKRGIPKHTVFQEGVITGTEAPDCTTVKLSNYPNRTCKGWDDKNNLHKVSKLNMKIQSIKLAQQIGQTLLISSFPDNVLSKLIKNAAESLTKLSKGINKHKLQSTMVLSIELTQEEKNYQMAVIYANVLNTIFESRQKGISYQEIFAPFDKIGSDISFANFGFKDTDDMYDRHKSLLQTIRKPGLKFAIIGKDHLLYHHDYDREARAAIDYLFSELERGKDENPYAVLAIR